MARYRIPSGVLRAALEEEEVLLNTETGVYHLLNRTGRALLASFEEGAGLDEATRRLAEETGEAVERVAADAGEFVRAMLARRLLEEVAR